MNGKKIIVARLWQKYDGRIPSWPQVVLQFKDGAFSTVCIYLEKKSDKPNYFQEHGCKVEFITAKGMAHFFNPLLVWRLVKVLKANKVDILHCHRHKATIYGVIAAKIAHVPIVFSHVHGLGRTRNSVRRFENRLLFKRVNKILAISDAVRNDIIESNQGISEEKVLSIGHGINFRKYADMKITKAQARELVGLPKDAFIFGTVGRLVPTKGQSDLVAAFAKVKKKIPNAHLAMIGGGRLEIKLKGQTAELGCQNAVTFAGRRTDVEKILRAFDCFVFPSVAEGLGCALLEAMASSLPCIGSIVGGIPEVLNSEKVGSLVPVNDVNMLAQAMIDYATISEQERIELGKNAKERVREFYSDDSLAQRLEEIYYDELRKSGLRV